MSSKRSRRAKPSKPPVALWWLLGAAGVAFAVFAYVRLSSTPKLPSVPADPSAVYVPAPVSQRAAPQPTQPVAQPTQAARPALPTTADKPARPSFDCSATKQTAERLVCTTPLLAVMDLSMANAYREARSRRPERQEEIKNTQNSWVQGQRNACNDGVCLQRVYEERIRELNAF